MTERPPALDRFAHTNPAFGAVCLHWTCSGYAAGKAKRKQEPRGLSPVWAMLSLAFLAAQDSRQDMPEGPQGKLALLVDKHPEWRAFAADAIRIWSAPFWDSIRLGIATRTLGFEHGRVIALGEVGTPRTPDDLQLREQAIAWGKLLAKEESDPALASLFNIDIGPSERAP